MCDLYVYRTDTYARENDSVSFHKALTMTYLERTKTINPNGRKGWSVRSQMVNRKVISDHLRHLCLIVSDRIGEFLIVEVLCHPLKLKIGFSEEA